MRLIDADELEKVIKQDWFVDILLTQTSKHDMAKNLVNMIDSVPLAYDVDAVVEELEKNKTPLKEAVVANHISISINNELIKIKNSDIDKYIAIVRRGGVNENNN